MVDVRETPKGHAIDVGTIYAYSTDAGLRFWAPNLANRMFNDADALARALTEEVGALAERANGEPRYFEG